MRLVKSKIYRAFPELDRFSDEQCQRFVATASKGVFRLGLRWGLMFLALVLVSGGLLWLAETLYSRWEFVPGMSPSNALLFVSTLGVLSVSLLAGFLAALVVRDWMLRWRIRHVVRARGRCHGCGYVLLGLPVGEDLQVRCPECGLEMQVDPALGELALDAAGAKTFVPKNNPLDPEAIARRIRRRKKIVRWTMRIATVVVFVPALAYGVWWLGLWRQANRAAALRVPAQKLIDLVGSDAAVSSETQGRLDWDRVQSIVDEASAVSRAEYVRIQSQFGEATNADIGMVVRWATPDESSEDRRTREQSRVLATNVLEKLDKSEWPERAKALIGLERMMPPIGIAPGEPLGMISGPGLGTFRATARINLARMQLARERGDDDTYFDAIEETLSLARIAHRPPTLIGYLVRESMNNYVLKVVRNHACERNSASWLARAQGVLADERWNSGHEVAIKACRLICRDEIAAFFCNTVRVQKAELRIQDEANNPFAGMGFGPDDLARREPGWTIGTLEENVTSAEAYFDAWEIRAAQLPHQRTGAWPSRTDRLALLEQVIPALGSVEKTADATLTRRLGLLVMLGVERYHVRTGSYPESLDQLTVPDLGHTRTDPFSGLAFGYRRVDATTDPLKREYLLWSVGRDRKDNRGAMDDKRRSWRAIDDINPDGLDYVVNEPE